MRALHTHTSQKVGNSGTIARNAKISQPVQTNGGITKPYQNIQQYKDKLTTDIYSSITQVDFLILWTKAPYRGFQFTDLATYLRAYSIFLLACQM